MEPSVVESADESPEKLAPPKQAASPKPQPQKRFLTVCGIVRDELDLPEWVAYQFAIGADHVHLIDNESVTPVAETLRKWVKAGLVSVESVEGRKQQLGCYSRYVKVAPSRWVAFIDADEFILPNEGDDVKTLLADLDEFGGLGVTWKVFGSNGHVARPNGLVIESYTKTSEGWFDVTPHSLERWPQYKSIVQPKHVICFPNSHYATYVPGKFSVNGSGKRMPKAHSHGPGSVERLQINHYFGKSQEDFRLKQERRGPNSNRARTGAEWEHLEASCNAVEDRRILRFVPRVLELMEEYNDAR